MFWSSNDIVPAQTLLGTLHVARAKQWWRGQIVGGDIGHVSKRGEREVRKVERLDEGDLGGGELAVRAEWPRAPAGGTHLSDSSRAWRASLLRTLETCARAAKSVPAWSPRNTSSSSAGVGMGPAIERARSDAISSVRFGSFAFVLGPALLCPSRKRFFSGLNPTESRFRKSTDRMPSQTHALPPAEPTPALAALAEVFGGAYASPLSLTDGRVFPPMREVRRSARRQALRPPSPGAVRQVRSETCIARDWANASI